MPETPQEHFIQSNKVTTEKAEKYKISLTVTL